jgi:predicted adenylyl cyclase CyaB
MHVTGSGANVEIKARVADLAALRARAERLATARLGIDRQVDTYFRVASGRLKLRESSLSGGQLVPYRRPDQPGARRSDYLVVPVEDPERLKSLLAAMLGVHRVVRKTREILLVENVRVHLDEVEGLGSFLELEAVFDGSDAGELREREKVAGLLRELGVADGQLVATSYEALLPEPACRG